MLTKRIWQVHSWLGLVAGLGLLVIGVTGSLLVFRDELEAWRSPALVNVEPANEGRLPLDKLLHEARQSLPGYEPTGWFIRSEPRRADLIYLSPHDGSVARAATIDPYRGHVLSSPLSDRQTLTGILLELHYTFFAGHTGIFLAGLLAASLCALGVSGVWLYRGFWRNFFTLRWGRSARIFFSDAHKMIGISSVAFNLVLGFTGAYWNLTHVFGDLVGGEAEEKPVTQSFLAAEISVDALLARAQEKLPGFVTGFISLPSHAGDDLTLWGSIEPRGLLRSEFGCMVTFDGQSGALKQAIDLRQAGLWEQALDSFRPLHFGNFGGLPIKILWSLGGLTPGALAVLGFLIWRSRRVAARRGKAQPSAETRSGLLRN